MSKAWVTKDKFLVGPQRRVRRSNRRRGQVVVGPQDFPPPSEEEVQELIDQIEESARLVDEAVGFDATLKARFGQEFVDYLEKLSEGLHYLLLQGRRPGPPPGFEADEPEIEITPRERGAPELGPAEELPRGMAAMKQPVRQIVARIDDTVSDLERLVGDSLEDVSQHLRKAGGSPDPMYSLDEAADAARTSLAKIKEILAED